MSRSPTPSTPAADAVLPDLLTSLGLPTMRRLWRELTDTSGARVGAIESPTTR